MILRSNGQLSRQLHQKFSNYSNVPAKQDAADADAPAQKTILSAQLCVGVVHCAPTK